ncbi:transglutaminase family protein [Acinetobacter bouvetii]|uniref:Transglutaminase-like superfamily protein n=1 Tax=Acinetobacter bouvetii TaxID=202951 RepID=A0A811GBB3_9GAMM|nr:transglutaminase family protein [Acinetobacter bouvetii]CAB1213136.1 Transglutaminase-like superfamily protein [Acinetobacter bouvetii]
MKLMINHQTHYHYSDVACNSIQYIKMTPVSNLHQHVYCWDVSVPGQKEIKSDAFNNIWITSSQRQSYNQMSIMAQGVVEINQTTQFGVETDINPKLFLQPTFSTLCNAEMKSFAECYVPRVNRANLIALSEAILGYIPYTPDQTSVQTSAIEAFQCRQGVCQDHSHVFIAMCKYLGLPARYVSGYLFVPNTAHLASHAWAEVFLENTWYCFDTSNQLFTPNSHIYVAIGRDYWDVAPVRGIRERGGIESMHSIVQVLAC